MSTEALEIHQPTDALGNKQYLPFNGSVGDGLHGFLPREKSVLRGGSLPSLVDVSSQLDEDDDEDTFNYTNNHEGNAFIKVIVEQN